MTGFLITFHSMCLFAFVLFLGNGIRIAIQTKGEKGYWSFIWAALALQFFVCLILKKVGVYQ